MIVIKSIEVFNIDENRLRFLHNHCDKPTFRHAPTADHPVETTLTIEEITGQRFTNANGQKICIGMSEQVQEAIGLPMSIFAKMDSDLLKLELETEAYRGMGFWERLRFLFTGRLQGASKERSARAHNKKFDDTPEPSWLNNGLPEPDPDLSDYYINGAQVKKKKG